jgi:RNA polymerase sigma-70 factor, ECF subfamily
MSRREPGETARARGRSGPAPPTRHPLAGDSALLAAATAGDPSAFGHLIERHRQGLTLYCYLMLGDPDAAHHAMAQTVLTAWLELNVIGAHNTVRTWLYRIAIRACFEATDDR